MYLTIINKNAGEQSVVSLAFDSSYQNVQHGVKVNQTIIEKPFFY